MRSPRKLLRLFAVSAITLTVTLTAFFLLLSPASAIIGNVFATTTGTGSACTQAAPCALQTALINAPTGASIYVAGGTYFGSGGAVVTLTRNNALLGGWNGASSGNVVRDPAMYLTRLDGQNVRRVIYISGDVTPTVDGFTIMRGNATGMTSNCSASSAGGCGGGIFVYQAHPIISNNVITNNVAMATSSVYAQGHGGGIYLETASNAIISGNLILSNTAALVYQGEGGGIDVNGLGATPDIRANQILNNVAPTWGGGLSISYFPAPFVQGNVLQGNRSDLGAGIFEWYGDAQIIGNRITGNTGDSAAYAGFSRSLLDRNLIINNATSIGLNLLNGRDAPMTVTNNIIARSGSTSFEASGYSGGVFTATLAHNTLAGSGNGTGVNVDTAFVTLRMTNTLISGHTIGIYKGVTTSTVTAHTTLFDTNVMTKSVGAPLTIFYVGAPQFVDATAGDYHIKFLSDARDRALATNVTHDMEGDSRPIGALPDIGADETTFVNGVWLPTILK